jgi:hypothetical protein
LSIELHRFFELGILDGPTISPAQQAGQNLPRAAVFVGRPSRFGDENATPAGSFPARRPVVGAGNRNLIDRRRLARMSVQVVMRLVGLAFGLQQRRAVLHERHAEIVRSGRRRDAGLELRIHLFIDLVVPGRLDGERRRVLAIQ